MSFIQSIYDKRHKFYLNFANEFFTKELWEKVLDEDKNACVLLCAFYSAIKNRCNTSVKETSSKIKKLTNNEKTISIRLSGFDVVQR